MDLGHGPAAVFFFLAVLGAVFTLNGGTNVATRRIRGRAARTPIIRGQEAAGPFQLRIGVPALVIGLVGLAAVWLAR